MSIDHLIHAYGLGVVASVIGLESAGIPFPGETALILAAVLAGTKHQLNIFLVILTATGAATVGQAVGYLIGREFGYWLLLRYGVYVRITESRIKLGEYLFLRHGGKIVFVARFVPFLRAIAGILAGANRMPWRHFIVANVAGAVIWSAGLGFGAYMFGREIERLAGPVIIVIGIATVVIVVLGINFVRHHEAQLTAEAERALPGPLRWQP